MVPQASTNGPSTWRARRGAESIRSAAGSCPGRTGARRALAGRAGGRAMRRIWLRGGALAAGSALLAGCQFGGLNSVALPGTAGHGPGSYSITVDLADVATLPQNSPVMVDDVTVGSVSGIDAMQRSRRKLLCRSQIGAGPQRGVAGQLDRPGGADLAARFPARRAGAPRRTSRRSAGWSTVRPSRSPAPVAIRPPRRCSPRSVWWSTRAIWVRCKRSPTRPIRRSPVGKSQFVNLVPRLAELDGGAEQPGQRHRRGHRRIGPVLGDPGQQQGQPRADAGYAARSAAVLNKNRDNIVEAFGALKKVATVAAHVLSQTKVDFAEDLKRHLLQHQGAGRQPQELRHVAADVADVPVPELRHQAGGAR